MYNNKYIKVFKGLIFPKQKDKNLITTKCGFVATVGRPNAGKSSLLNWLVGEKITMVSHKANATRKRSNVIVMSGDDQIVFIDTPGLHEKENERANSSNVYFRIIFIFSICRTTE